jgi:molybdopterin-guanine dinucleotide biosynthesis protein A
MQRSSANCLLTATPFAPFSIVMNIKAVILAGGRAQRMGGGDKSLLTLGNQTILERVVDRLAKQTPRGRRAIALSANGPAARFAALGLPVLADTVFGSDGQRLGPLAGILAGLEWGAANGADAIMTVAADTPFFPRALVNALLRESAPIVLASAPDETGKVWDHPTFGLWSTALADDLRDALTNRGLRKILRWADAHGAKRVVFPRLRHGETQLDSFFNVNTPEDLALARRMLEVHKDAL